MEKNINILESLNEFKIAKDYWLCKLSLPLTSVKLPFEIPSKKELTHKSDDFNIILDTELSSNLISIAKNKDLSLYVLLLSAFKVLLYKYTEQNDIIISSPLYDSNEREISMNHLVLLRDYLKSEDSFMDYLLEVSNTVLEAYKNQHYPTNKLLSDLGINPEVALGGNIIFALKNIHSIDSLNNIISLKSDRIVFLIEKLDHKIAIQIVYNSCLYSSESITKFAQHYVHILNQISLNIKKKIRDVELITDEEKEHIFIEFNDNNFELSEEKCINELFQEQAEKTPNKIAVVFKDNCLTYEELNAKANQIARRLNNASLGKGDIVAVMIPRSIDILAGILGILKAGAVCLPIDITNPPERIMMILKESGAVSILKKGIVSCIKDFTGEVIDIGDEQLEEYSSENMPIQVSSSDVCYLIFTSGSTGKPKGVMLKHLGIINHAFAKIKEIDINDSDVVSQNLNLSFVASIWQFMAPLFIGAQINIYDEDTANDSYELLNAISRDGVTILEIVPTMLNSYLDLLEVGKKSLYLSGLKALVLTGERVLPSLVNRFYSIYSVQLVNAYGQSECSDDTFHYTIPKKNDMSIIPIGKPAINTEVYIVNNDGNIQPIGLPGEICIAGKGLAQGYLNDSEMTSTKFINNRFIPGNKIYKTGDFGRWLEDGNVECIGRIDQQVKLHGNRIELSEIENVLLQHEYVKSAIVVLKELGGSQYLCAYMVMDKKLDMSELKSYISFMLPKYMIPTYFTKLEKLPLAPNGKVDRLNLPEPNISQNRVLEDILPQSDVEIGLAELWKDVLGVDSIRLYDNFFDLGGHSLKATVLAAKIQMKFEVKIKIREIFEKRTLKELAEYIECSEKYNFSEIKPVKYQEYYPASSAQKRIYILEQIEVQNNANHVPIIIHIDGRLDLDRLKKSFNSLILRHESFRTSFNMVDGELVQIIEEQAEIDIVDSDTVTSEIGVNTIEFIKPFDLSKAPLIRIGIVKQSNDSFDIILDMHHIIIDGVSIGIAIRDLVMLYNEELLQPLRIQYKDFSVWQRNLLKSEQVEKQVNYWRSVFYDGIPALDLPTDYPRPALKSYEGDTIAVELGLELSKKLTSYALENGVTLYMVMLAAFNVLLYKHSNQEDIVVGTPIAGREHADLEDIVGMFVNTMPMRNFPKHNITFKDFLHQVCNNAIKTYEHQTIQFEELVQLLDVKRDLSRNPIFDVMFILQNTNIQNIKTKYLNFKIKKFCHQVSKFDLTLEAIIVDENIELYFEYCSSIFSKETIERYAEHYLKILTNIIENDKNTLVEIDMISESEKKWIFDNFNNTTKNYNNIPIYRAFEQRIASCVDTGKLICDNDIMPYSELNRRANQLAHFLKRNDVKNNQPVAIMIHRSIDMIIGILGIIKAGGAYVPLDPSYPVDRIEYMIKHCGATIIITEDRLLDKTSEILKNNTNIKVILDISGKSRGIAQEGRKVYNKSDLEVEDTSNLLFQSNVEDLLYIIYTSGSTGLPKGVMVTHLNAMNFLNWAIDTLGTNHDDTMMLVTSISFDISVFEIFGALLSGSDLVIMSDDKMHDINSILDCMEERKVSIWHSVPVLMNQAIIALNHRNDIDNLKTLNKVRKILIGGEVWSVELAKEIRKIYKNAELINMYGPTETTIWATSYKVDDDLNNLVSLPIGKPIANNRILIMDSNSKICAIGIPGEIYISGDNVTRGYFMDDNKTREVFIQDSNSGEIIYKTGDQGRYLGNGTIEFLGRKDGMVKVRGYRIEVGEIENLLLGSGKISEVAVVAQKDGITNRLICYYVSSEEHNAGEFVEYLRHKISDYMIPAHFIRLEKMIVTPNGKIDRKTLSNMEVKDYLEISSEYIEPSTEIEKFLVGIWRRLLGTDQIGIHDNFFSIGGNSFLLTQMYVDIDTRYHGKLQIVDLFSYTTIETLAKYLANKTNYKEDLGVKEDSSKFDELLNNFENDQITAEEAAKLFSEMRI